MSSAAQNTGAVGAALTGFDAALRRLRTAIDGDAAVADAVFSGAESWSDLLIYKLVPHLAGDGCLIAAVTGGTNTGKSTVFNLLVGRAVSPMMATAAATRRPLLAANAMRADQCLEAKLVPEFDPRPLETGDDVVGRDAPVEALYVTVADHLPDHLALLDTPDVDSIDREHWEVAEHIRAAGDVLVAVLTAEKYKDERVVAYFHQARASGRVVVPVMNKANPDEDFAVARKQLDEFCADVGLNGPCFVVPHDFDLAKRLDEPVKSLTTDRDLLGYLQELDVPDIKRRVYRDTVRHFAEEAGAFLTRAESVGAGLQSVVTEFEDRAASFAAKYDPMPGAEVGGLFHEFVQSKRGAVRRGIGAASKSIVKGVSAVGRGVRDALFRRATLESKTAQTEDELRAQHVQVIERIARDLATGYLESAQNLREPAGHLLRSPLENLDIDAAVAAVTKETIQSEDISDAFRAYAYQTLEQWWQDHKGRRRFLEALDALLAITPAAIAVPVSIHTGGIGVAESVALAGPLVEQLVARVIEYQFGDALFDFLSPWREEQRAALERALRAHIVEPCLAELRPYADALEGDIMTELRKWQEQCLEA